MGIRKKVNIALKHFNGTFSKRTVKEQFIKFKEFNQYSEAL